MASVSSSFGSSAGAAATAASHRDGKSEAVATAEATDSSTAVADVTGAAEDGEKREDVWILKPPVGPLWLDS